MADIYVPENVPTVYDPTWLQKELQRMADLLNEPELPLITYSVVHVEPSKKREGMVVNADGTDWNPGYGAGLYIYLNNSWNKINNNHVSTTATATATQYAKLRTYSFPATNDVSAVSTLLLTPIGNGSNYKPIEIEVVAKQGASGLDTTNAQINVIRNSEDAVLYNDFDLVTATAANGTDMMLWMRSVVATKYAVQIISEEFDTGVSVTNHDVATWTATNPVTGAAASVTSDWEKNNISGLPYALVSNSSAQSIPNATTTKKTFNTVNYDADGLWNAANNRFIIPAAALVEIVVSNSWVNNAAGVRYMHTAINGGYKAGLPRLDDAAALNTEQNMVGVFTCAANDYIEISLYQNTGGALNTLGQVATEWFSVRVLKWL